MTVRVHIDRLVIEGLPLSPGDRPLLQAAVESELARLLAAPVPGAGTPSGSATPYVRAPGISAEGTPAELGRQIAHAVYRGLPL